MDTSMKDETREAMQHLVKTPRNRCEVDRTNMGEVRTEGKKGKRWRAVVNVLCSRRS
jgi:hypothetical protein